MTYKATKIVIITEKIILEGVTKIIEEAGASGYTIVTAGGKGSRGIRPSGGPLVVDAFSNIKIEVITATREMGEAIADAVAANCLSGLRVSSATGTSRFIGRLQRLSGRSEVIRRDRV